MTTNGNFTPVRLTEEAIRSGAEKCEILILAGGFEDRSRRLLEVLQQSVPKRVALVEYPGMVPENEENHTRMVEILEARGVEPVPVLLDPRRPDDFYFSLRSVFQNWRPDTAGEVWIDISALPMQGICTSLAALRETFVGPPIRVLYTEAKDYFPKGPDDAQAISQEMSANLVPKLFRGSSSEVATCLIVFAGYEPHRSFGVVDDLNPTKLVLAFGNPPREDLIWRAKWSREIHQALLNGRPTATEDVSTLDPVESLRMLSQYYQYLFVDHNIVVSPICSKMQCVSSFLFWERFRDVQLIFPLPVSYMPSRVSAEYLSTYGFLLPTPSEIARLAPAIL